MPHLISSLYQPVSQRGKETKSLGNLPQVSSRQSRAASRLLHFLATCFILALSLPFCMVSTKQGRARVTEGQTWHLGNRERSISPNQSSRSGSAGLERAGGMQMGEVAASSGSIFCYGSDMVLEMQVTGWKLWPRFPPPFGWLLD